MEQLLLRYDILTLSCCLLLLLLLLLLREDRGEQAARVWSEIY